MNNSVIDKSLLQDIIILWRFLGKRRHTQLLLLLILMLVAVLAEMVSIGTVIPFLTALTTPELLFKITWLKPAFAKLDISNSSQLLLPLTLLFIAATILSAFIKALLVWANGRLTSAITIQLSSELYTRVLYQPYEYHIANNSSQLIATLTQKVWTAISSGVLHVLTLINALTLSISIIVTLMIINTWVAVGLFLVLGGGYFLIGYLVKNRIASNGLIIAKNQPLLIKCMQEGVGGIRDVIISGSQPMFSTLYTKTAYHIQTAVMQNSFLGNIPKQIIEALGIISIASIAYLMQSLANEETAELPLLGALALGAQRLLPSLQQAYLSWSTIKGSQEIIAEINQNLTKIRPTKNSTPSIRALPFQSSIHLQNITFQYAGANKKTLKNTNIAIPKGSRVGFIGETGSGKSTLLDIVMGLILPTEGKLIVDNAVIDQNNISAWQVNIAHVPQSIFLSDASIEENIAFGIHKEKIDLNQVKKAAKQAHISDFIESLPNTYQTLVGERGICLSGGQRQRIGIARALYKKASVIIFDEATSALDNETETNVMEAIESLSGDLTILIIAHRLSTLKGCNIIYKLNQGQVINSGSFSEILKTA